MASGCQIPIGWLATSHACHRIRPPVVKLHPKLAVAKPARFAQASTQRPASVACAARCSGDDDAASASDSEYEPEPEPEPEPAAAHEDDHHHAGNHDDYSASEHHQGLHSFSSVNHTPARASTSLQQAPDIPEPEPPGHGRSQSPFWSSPAPPSASTHSTSSQTADRSTQAVQSGQVSAWLIAGPSEDTDSGEEGDSGSDDENAREVVLDPGRQAGQLSPLQALQQACADEGWQLSIERDAPITGLDDPEDWQDILDETSDPWMREPGALEELDWMRNDDDDDDGANVSMQPGLSAYQDGSLREISVAELAALLVEHPDRVALLDVSPEGETAPLPEGLPRPRRIPLRELLRDNVDHLWDHIIVVMACNELLARQGGVRCRRVFGFRDVRVLVL